MLRILSGSFRNFLSIGNVTQDLDLMIDGLTLILGENMDVGGVNSRNGSGKTSILQAISYGLFGKPLTKIRLDNLTNSINNKAMLVTLDLESNGRRYRIERGRKPTVLRFFQDNIAVDEAQGESRHTQTEIERVLGMSYQMFRHIVALSTSTIPFLREEASVQREVIEELFGIMQLSQRAEALKGLMDLSKEQLRDAEAAVRANSEANARIQLVIDRAVAEAGAWQSTHQQSMYDLQGKIAKLYKIDMDAELAVFDAIDAWEERQQECNDQQEQIENRIATLADVIERFEKDITRYEGDLAPGYDEMARLIRQAELYRAETTQDIQPQLRRLQDQIIRLDREAADTTVDAERLAEELLQIDYQLAHPDDHLCPTCGQQLAGTDHLAEVTTKLTQRREQLTKGIATRRAEHDQITASRGTIDVEIEQSQATHLKRCQEAEANAVAIEQEIERTRHAQEMKRTQVEQQIIELRQMLDAAVAEHATWTKRHDALVVKDDPKPESRFANREIIWQMRTERDVLVSQFEAEMVRPNPLAEKVEGLQSTLMRIDYTQVNDLTLRLKHEAFLHKLLTARESFIRKKIVDQNLSYLNRRLDHYLTCLGLPHEVVFMPDLTVEISLLGREFDFEQLSRGEMNRVIMANSFAFRDTWENLNTTVNLLLVDEVLDQGTDGAGVEAALDILTAMAGDRHKSVFLISHRDELRDRIDHVLTVRKENQFTSFIM